MELFRARELKSDQPTREFKSFSFELESADESTGEFSGYAAVFGNRDSGNDIIEKGAFAKTIVEDFNRIKIFTTERWRQNELLDSGCYVGSGEQ